MEFKKKEEKSLSPFLPEKEMLKKGGKAQNRDRMSLQTGNTIRG